MASRHLVIATRACRTSALMVIARSVNEPAGTQRRKSSARNRLKEYRTVSKCPVCSSESAQTINSFSAREAAQHFVLREASPKRNSELTSYITTLWGGDDCAVRQCNECGFGFADPYIAGDVTFYNLAFDRKSYPGDKWEFRRTLRELSSTRL
jgi:hypothetical protein